MKKLIAALIAVLLVYGVVLSLNGQNEPAPVLTPAPVPAADAVTAGEVPAEEAAEAPDAEAAPEIPEVRGLDYEALHALHDDNDVVMTLAGETETWSRFYAWLQANGMQVEDYFRQMAEYYQIAPDWSGSAGSGQSFAAAVVEQAKDDLTSMMLIRAFAAEKGISLTEEDLAGLAPDAIAVEILGEGTTADDLREIVESRLHMSLEDYIASDYASQLFRRCYEELFGANGENLPEEEIVAWLEGQDYLSASHILLLTIDPMTGQALDEETVSQKKAQAQKLFEELSAIEDQQALAARFAELKAEFCEDSGKAAYPDGYTFTPGTMVPEFEDAVRALDNYGVSAPVESSYGLHVIMRLPLGGESLLYSSQGTPNTARVQMAALRFAEEVDAFLEAHPVEYAEGVEDLDLTQFVLAE